MRILLTNDDGIHAPGLKVLEEIARELSDDLWIFAPETDQSGVSHSLSLNDPLRLRMVDERRYAVKGTPTDCVIMGLRHVLKDNPPDLILSGVNRGQNVAEDVTYSGTIAGAMRGRCSAYRRLRCRRPTVPTGARPFRGTAPARMRRASSVASSRRESSRASSSTSTSRPASPRR
jgi:5'/3'-nucleotidase SurE